MDDRFFRAFFPPEVRILGYRLRPFCAGHLLLLSAVGSPLIAQGEGKPPATPGDLLLALRICEQRHPYETVLRPRLRDVWRRIRVERNRKLYAAAMAGFARYVEMHTAQPVVRRRSPNGKLGKPLTAPGCLALVTGLMIRGIPEAEAWEMSLGRAAWIDAAMSEREGADIVIGGAYDDVPLPPEMSEEEAVAEARRVMPAAVFKMWLRARQKLQNR